MNDFEKVYISIGADCDTATMLKSLGKRAQGFMFDWVVAYKDIAYIFEKELKGYGENVELVFHKKFQHDVHVNKDYKILFLHHRGSDHLPQALRRTERLINLMKDGQKELIFVRAGHRDGHHIELDHIDINSPNFDETQDMKNLRDLLRLRYPNLKFKIYLYNRCKQCNDMNSLDEPHLCIKHIENEQLKNEIHAI